RRGQKHKRRDRARSVGRVSGTKAGHRTGQRQRRAGGGGPGREFPRRYGARGGIHRQRRGATKSRSPGAVYASVSAGGKVMTEAAWPELPLAAWKDTYATLHRWTQIAGKVRLALSPRANHWWHTPLYVSAHGLTTSPIPYGARIFEVEFDFVS